MTDEKLAELKAAIEQAITSCEADIASLEQKVEPIAPDSSIGRLSRMEAIEERSVFEANLRQAEERLEKLQRAQSRLGDDDFGYCEVCGCEIPIKRLLLIPETRRCVNCAD